MASSVAAELAGVQTQREALVKGCAVALRQPNAARYAARAMESGGLSQEAAQAEGEYVMGTMQSELEDTCRCFLAELSTDSIVAGNVNLEPVFKERGPLCIPLLMEALKKGVNKVDIEAYRARVRSGQP